MLAVLAAVLAASASGAETDLTLASGETVRGVVIEDTPDQVRLRRTIAMTTASIEVVVTYPRQAILQMQAVPVPNPEYDARAAVVADTAAGHLALAKWCRDEDLPEQARVQAMRAHELAPQDPEVAIVLIGVGYTYADGAWQDANTYLLSTGRMRYHGHVMSQADADAQRSRADDEARLHVLAAQAAASSATLDHLRSSYAAVSRELLDLPDQLSAQQERIRAAREAEHRFDALLSSTEPGVIPGAAPGAAAGSTHLDLASLRAQAENAYQALPVLLKQRSELTTKVQILAADQSTLLDQLRAAQRDLARANAEIADLRSDALALGVSAH